tara:strand:- start:83 stop:403 length:321 start_codon:yes stop_codon:yes gene_type:complete
MGDLVKADFKIKLDRRLKQFDPKNLDPEYQCQIFKELYSSFPQFKAHVAAFVERRYCVALNDEDHGDPQAVIEYLNDDEIRQQNEWILGRKRISKSRPGSSKRRKS